MMRAGGVFQLVRPTARAIRWLPVPLAGVTALGVLYGIKPDPIEGASVSTVINDVRLAGLLLVLGAVFAFEDSARETICCVPTRLAIRRTVRVALVLPALVVLWLVVFLVAKQVPVSDGRLPLSPLLLEFVAMTVAALAIAAAADRVSPDSMGAPIAAGPISLIVASATLLLPERFALIVSTPDGPAWDAAHTRWRIAFLVAAFALAWFCRDQGRPRLRARIRRAARWRSVTAGPTTRTLPEPSSADRS